MIHIFRRMKNSAVKQDKQEREQFSWDGDKHDRNRLEYRYSAGSYSRPPEAKQESNPPVCRDSSSALDYALPFMLGYMIGDK